MQDRELLKTANFLRTSLPKVVQGHRSVKEALNFTDEQLYAWAAMACQLAEQGNRQDAHALLEGLAVIEPDNGFLHSCLGTFYFQIGEKALAIGELRFALSKNGKDISANLNLAELYFESRDYQQAQQYAQQAIDLDETGNDPSGLRARALKELILQHSK